MDVLMQNKPNLLALRYLIIFNSQTNLYVEQSLRRNKCKFELLLYSRLWSGSHYNIHMWITNTTSSDKPPSDMQDQKQTPCIGFCVQEHININSKSCLLLFCADLSPLNKSNSWISPLHGLVITACNSFWLDFKFTNSFTGFPLSLHSTKQ